MYMLRILLIAVVSISIVHAKQASAADRGDSGFRIGLGIGSGTIDFDRGFNGDDTTLSAFAAYDFNRYVGVEANYTDGGSPQDLGIKVDRSEAAAMVIGSLPLIGDVWSISARAGVVAWSWSSAGIEHEGTDLTYGIGTALDFKRMQFELIGDTADIDTARIIHVSLRGAWKF
jgi:hypothetical protein